MRESTAYQAILDEGRLEEAAKIILRQGRRKIGNPSPAEEAALREIADLERLERISDRVLEAVSWQELLATS